MITFETPEDYPVQIDAVEEPEITIIISGKQINRISNVEIYFQEEKKDEV